MTKRLLELDVLRCLAIILVMFRHFHVSEPLTRAGWIGVDLFFVLSGFLVSGLIFYEFQNKGKIDGSTFLIRRGLKIYPVFYFVLIIHIIYFFYKGFPITWQQILTELLFIQNFQLGIIGISWTLAIEEHFYLILLLFSKLAIRFNYITKQSAVLAFCTSILLFCLLFRLFLGYSQPFDEWSHFFPTYLRLDSLFSGVMISWVYHFKRNAFNDVVKSRSLLLILLVLCGPAMAIIYNLSEFPMFTFGLTLLYLSFGSLLCLLLFYRLPNNLAFKTIAFVGKHSYAIYLIHVLVGPGVANYFKVNLYNQAHPYILAAVSFLANIVAGILISLSVESYFLRLREKYFPKANKMSRKTELLQTV